MPQRCAYFSTDALLLPAESSAIQIRIPVYRCCLSETVIARLDETATPNGCVPLGPDLEVVSPATCTPARCQTRCRPAFQNVLSEYRRDDSLPHDRQRVQVA